jgi:hypothetical protein
MNLFHLNRSLFHNNSCLELAVKIFEFITFVDDSTYSGLLFDIFIASPEKKNRVKLNDATANEPINNRKQHTAKSRLPVVLPAQARFSAYAHLLLAAESSDPGTIQTYALDARDRDVCPETNKTTLNLRKKEKTNPTKRENLDSGLTDRRSIQGNITFMAFLQLKSIIITDSAQIHLLLHSVGAHHRRASRHGSKYK